MARRLAALALALCLGSFAFSQENLFAVRITNCAGIEGQNLTVPVFCNATAFYENPSLGVFTQVSPKYGPPQDNFQVRAYRPVVKWDFLGVRLQSQPGVTVGRETGDWFARVEMDTLFSISW